MNLFEDAVPEFDVPDDPTREDFDALCREAWGDDLGEAIAKTEAGLERLEETGELPPGLLKGLYHEYLLLKAAPVLAREWGVLPAEKRRMIIRKLKIREWFFERLAFRWAYLFSTN